jgi:hypothetical protein
LTRCVGFARTCFALGSRATSISTRATVGKIGLCVHTLVRTKGLAHRTGFACPCACVAKRCRGIGTIRIAGAFALHRLDTLAC